MNLEVPYWRHKFAGLGEMLTFKSSTKRLDGEKEEEGLFDEK
jgi:hypothetical protein